MNIVVLWGWEFIQAMMMMMMMMIQMMRTREQCKLFVKK